MSKTLALNNFLVGIFPQQKAKIAKFQSAVKSVESTNFYIGIALLAINAVLLGSYIYGVNNYASQGYEIRSVEAKISDLNANLKDLNLQVARATSMTSIQSDFISANFIPAGTPKFLQAGQENLTYNRN